jgi:hypothetical protein
MELSGQLHAPAALPPGKEPWYPLDKRLGGPQSPSGRFLRRKFLVTFSESACRIAINKNDLSALKIAEILQNSAHIEHLVTGMC